MNPVDVGTRRFWLITTCLGTFFVTPVSGQAPTRIYLEPFGNRAGPALREALIKLLRSQKNIVIANSAAEADRVLSGMGETHIRGYLSRNPRVRYLNNDSQPVYGGFLSVELKDPKDETLWSYLVTPRRFGPEDINQNLAGQVVTKLLQFLGAPPATP